MWSDDGENAHFIDYSISDLVDINELRAVFERFTQATGFTVGFLDHPGLNVLIATGWKDICTKFHRASPDSAAICRKSNRYLLEQLKEPHSPVIETCGNGLVDCAVPIIVNGRHIASLATGQLLLEEPDINHFKMQAELFGFNVHEYLEALKDVRVVSEERVRNVTAFLGEMASFISKVGYSNLIAKEKSFRLETEIAERKWAEDKLQKSEGEKAILNQIASVFLTIPDESIYEEVLAVILKALKSKYGIFGYIGDSGDLIIPSLTKEIWRDCQVNKKSIVFPRHSWGDSLWGKAIKEKKSFYSEGPFQTPEGHLPIYNFLAVPVVFADKTIGLTSVANKDGGFSEEDQTVLERIADNISPILNARLQRDKQELERTRAEDELKESQQKLADIIDFLPDATAVFDMDSKVIAWNRAMEEMTGVSKKEMIGKGDYDYTIPFYGERRPHLIDLIDSHDVELESKYQYVTRKGGILYSETYVPLVFGGAGAYVFATAAPLFDARGHRWGAIESIRDVTARKQAEEERRRLEERLQRAEKMEALGTLAGGVAHDLNNVLGVVVGYSELLLRAPDVSSSTKSKAAEILKGGQKAAAIVQDLLTLARRGIQDRNVVNLNTVLLESQGSPEFAKIVSYLPDITVKTDLEADLLNISGSSVHLEKSFINLVSNAVEAMRGGGILTIKTWNQYLDKPVSGYDTVSEGDYVVLSVSDTGEGISTADLKRIFEPFYTKKVMGRSGTGLGLAVVWGTVKDHYGYINVESEEGKGTTVTLYFPVTREDIMQEQVSLSAAEYMGNGESILVVDDVKEQRELAMAMLTKLNYRATAVSSGEEAVGYLKLRQVDLVVLDMIMDLGMDGLDTYSKILELHPKQKAIIVSGFSETVRVRKAQALGAGAYVKKPYVLEKLGLAVRQELDEA